MAKVAIIIVNYNGYDDTVECIKSIPKNENYKIVVVDNNSNNDEATRLQEEFEYVEVITSNDNLGFSGGNNLGIQYALNNNYDYIMLLNNDTIIENDMIDELLKYANKKTITVPKMCYYDFPQKVWYAGGKIDRIKGSVIHYGLKKNEEKYNRRKKCSFATGCCLLVDKDIIKNVGFLEEKYFMYCEDVDYSIRLNKNNIDIEYIPTAKLYHKVSASTGGENSPFSIYYMNRNRLIYLKDFSEYFLFSAKIYTYLTRYIKIIIRKLKRDKLYKFYKKALDDYRNNITGKVEL